MTYEEIISEIYSSYSLNQKLIINRFDREIKNPEICFAIAKKHGLLFQKENVIRITGSKGKGTTSQFISRFLMKNTDVSVGLMISPEELEHYDRIRINGESISRDEFISFYMKSKAVKEYLNFPFSGLNYASPYGLFLLLALEVFKEKNVKYLVLESGRGFLHDDLYFFPSEIGVITSIFEEHLNSLGPTLEDVKKEKEGIYDHSKKVFSFNDVPKIDLRDQKPNWLKMNYELSKLVVRDFLKKETLMEIEMSSPSLIEFKDKGVSYHLEALISEESLDLNFLKSLDPTKTHVFLCIPDDKDYLRVEEKLKEHALSFTHILIDSKKASLQFSKFRNPSLGPFQENEDFLKLIQNESKDKAKILIFGTHSFLRAIKKTL